MTRLCRTTMMPLAAAALCAAVVGCADQGRPVLSREKDPKSMKPAELQQFVSTKAALAGANAGAALTQLPTEPLPPPAPAVAPVPIAPAMPHALPPTRTVAIKAAVSVPETTRRVSPPAVKISNVTSGYCETEEDARYDALGVAAVMIAEKLSTLDPPISVNVRRNRVWNEFVSHSSAKVVPIPEDDLETLKNSKVSKNSVRYQFDVEISEHQLRDLRGEGRVKTFAPFALGGLVLCLGLSVLLKISGAAAAAVRRV